jgi:hypothetical protein
MATEPLPVHIPTAEEASAHVVERLTNDRTLVVRDATTGQVTTMRLGVTEWDGVLTLVAVGPGSS